MNIVSKVAQLKQHSPAQYTILAGDFNITPAQAKEAGQADREKVRHPKEGHCGAPGDK